MEDRRSKMEDSNSLASTLRVYPPSSIIGPGHTYGSITDKISAIVLTRLAPKSWFLGLIISFALLMMLLYALTYLFSVGVGIWGINIPVGWGVAIITFVWWIGIGHAGTLISAILLLFRQDWRTSINRFAEAMTLFAVACAGLFPLIHLGRPWLAYWIFPYPNTFGLWPQFRSPLVWDAVAIGTYGTVSLMFWFVGLIPDLASLRDRATNVFVRYLFGLLALGWRGSAGHWHRYETAYLLLAALATPLVVSVHSVVSLDFATSLIPGWHTTVFPPYFVAGAIFSGFAMVFALLIPLRKIYRLEDFITLHHLDNMAKIMLATGLVVAYGYLTEGFTAWYSGNPYEQSWLANRSFGPYGPMFWALMLCNVVMPQALWSGWVRSKPILLFLIALVINIGMWLERFVIIIVSLHQDFLPSSWGWYWPTIWDWLTLFGTIGLFLTMIFLFVRLLPMISIFEMRHLLTKTEKPEPIPALEAETFAGRADTSFKAPTSKAKTQSAESPLYGLLAEFAEPEVLLDRARRTYAAGYRRLSAYTPFPVEGLSQAIGLRQTRLPLLVLLGGIAGAVGGFFLQYYAAVLDYPWNIGGRPLNSWPSFMIVTFEATVLTAAAVTVVGMLVFNKLPMLYHPVFNAPRFKLASRDRFFLCIKATDPQFDVVETRQFLESLGPEEVVAVEQRPPKVTKK
jgi:molybdopterin-containing oxidoreductase family membrane subunit